jgi:histone-lysine N-methyltransferase SETMAR
VLTSLQFAQGFQAVIWFLNADSAWDIFIHVCYSLDMAPSDFHLFTHLEQFLGSTCMGSNEEVKKTVKDWFSGLAAGFYEASVQKLVTRYNKCLSLLGDYVEQ